MPQHISVAFVSKDEQLIKNIKKNLALPDSGINPRYYYLTPKDNVSNVLNQKDFKYAFIDLWITLDDESYKYAENQNRKDKDNENYDRGFYDQLLPDSIIRINQLLDNGVRMETLIELTKKILKAFCESS